MYKFDEKVADEIARCFDDPSLNPLRWFEEEINYAALKIPGLDDLPKKSLVVLAVISASGPLDVITLARKMECEVDEVEELIDELQALSLIAPTAIGHEVTAKGTDIFRAVGEKVIIRKRYEMKSRLEHLDMLYENITPQWHKQPTP